MHHVTMRTSKAAGPSLLPGNVLQGSESVQQGKLHVGPEWSFGMVTMGMALNVVCVVGVVAANKHVQMQHRFEYAILLSGMHFMFTAVVLRMLCTFNVFTYKPADRMMVLFKALLDCASVGLMNVNLAKNSVGIYQLSKLSCIPTTVAIQYILFGTKISLETALALLPLCLGVAMATVSDVRVTGTLYAIAAILATVVSQILTKSFVQNTGCTAIQLLYHTSLCAAVIMILLSRLFDDYTQGSYAMALILHQRVALTAQGVKIGHMPLEVLLTILISCVFAVGVNITNYQVLSRTSALTYQVLGHLKTALTLAMGILFFDKAYALKHVSGLFLAFGGMLAYAHVRQVESSSKHPGDIVWLKLLYTFTAVIVLAWPHL
ncbi:hypothetical protein GUITHDRAFT_136465 [Guillardia theta CCMP2712]|uniref:Sugar phosphate transporter domain-containing protein n=1 Tax=Guillardia theta (strain CCMP2712) TaxID=905079 RepID=L1JK00_GUITC|nr:hypothetical protein GUITHDRAFT_136465 [Guillardia theta CCMP2712]EKX48796.1 hypothetical protein GUITHDRAFT_136465 [Guillardia theta CCMP2712]|eukprot:XP_005835776.1 hypothetical protein GUITHDRAFT_136465 [Guillardia theta CCMP2712]